MAELEEKLGTILNNPQLMQQIMSMAQSLGQSAPAEKEPPRETPTASLLPDPELLRKISGITAAAGTDSQQTALLKALAPYVHREKLDRLERAMRAAKLAQLATSFLGSGGLAALTGR